MNEDNEPRGPMGERRLYRDRSNGMILGVCAGLSNYFGFDVTVTRLVAFLGLIFVPPTALLIYFGLVLLLPNKPDWERERESRRDAEFQRAVRSAPAATLSSVRHRFRELEGRLRRLEQYVTSRRFNLDREFQEMGRD